MILWPQIFCLTLTASYFCLLQILTRVVSVLPCWAQHAATMAQPKPLFIPWLKEQIDSARYPGVHWVNQECTKFSVPWKHALRQDSNSDDILIFKVKGVGSATCWHAHQLLIARYLLLCIRGRGGLHRSTFTDSLPFPTADHTPASLTSIWSLSEHTFIVDGMLSVYMLCHVVIAIFNPCSYLLESWLAFCRLSAYRLTTACFLFLRVCLMCFRWSLIYFCYFSM